MWPLRASVLFTTFSPLWKKPDQLHVRQVHKMTTIKSLRMLWAQCAGVSAFHCAFHCSSCTSRFYSGVNRPSSSPFQDEVWRCVFAVIFFTSTNLQIMLFTTIKISQLLNMSNTDWSETIIHIKVSTIFPQIWYIWWVFDYMNFYKPFNQIYIIYID